MSLTRCAPRERRPTIIATGRPTDRARAGEAVRRACVFRGRAEQRTTPPARKGLVRRLAPWGLAIAAAAIAAQIAWVAVVRPIEAAAGALGGVLEIAVAAQPEAPSTRVVEAEKAFRDAQSDLARAPGDPSPAARAEVARRTADLEAARDALGR